MRVGQASRARVRLLMIPGWPDLLPTLDERWAAKLIRRLSGVESRLRNQECNR